jgi:hypothetical protein
MQVSILDNGTAFVVAVVGDTKAYVNVGVPMEYTRRAARRHIDHRDRDIPAILWRFIVVLWLADRYRYREQGTPPSSRDVPENIEMCRKYALTGGRWARPTAMYRYV